MLTYDNRNLLKQSCDYILTFQAKLTRIQWPWTFTKGQLSLLKISRGGNFASLVIPVHDYVIITDVLDLGTLSNSLNNLQRLLNFTNDD